MILVIETDPHVGPGFVSDLIAEKGLASRYVRLGEGERLPPPEEVRGAVILGGRMGANDDEKFPFLTDLKQFVREAAACDTPVLGICLGGQLIAEALGGEVHGNRLGERGIGHAQLTNLGCFDPVFATLPYKFVTFHWHNDSFVIPEDAILLASNSVCPAQAFRFGVSIYGVQFHPEMTRETAQKWSEEEGDPSVIETYLEYEQDHRYSGRSVIGNFLTLAARG